ncbi:MAG TPA: 2,3,4,5-tetrahydropyridine-2,6-dicarboxylate N-succinyltransferase [Gammaproteobacteria bacterium]|nr:2,3,4,5-tetrahydropyridine-2,6-dicarboxylate N-succinyltransferase [Gammaproteobacteria bacterium]
MEALINQAFEDRAILSPTSSPHEIRAAVLEIISQLDSGKIRVAEKINNKWVTNETIKKAILLYFKLFPNVIQQAGFTNFFDKVPMKYEGYSEERFKEENVRVVPSAIVRKGAYIAPTTILMPSFVNVGAYIDTGVMVDTWATVGSCAQIGKNVHLSGGVGIGGVLEPLQATPTIIEDNCFIGARSEIVEGVIVEEGAVISMGVYIGQSTKIYNRMTNEITYGVVPKGAVVVPGSLPSKDKSHSIYCAVIVKFVDEQTRGKVALNELLRD